MVNFEVDKAEVIQDCQVITKLLVWLLINLVEVDSFWCNWHHLTDVHLFYFLNWYLLIRHALKFVYLLVTSQILLNVFFKSNLSDRCTKFYNKWIFNFKAVCKLIFFHKSLAYRHLDLFNWRHNDFWLYSNRFLIDNWYWNFNYCWLLDKLFHHILDWNLDKDVTPNFMTESYFVASLHSKVCGVSTRSFWCLQQDFPNIVVSWHHNSLNRHLFCIHLISAGLKENYICWPCDFSTITVCPLFSKSLTWHYLVLITNAFLHKATFITRFALLTFRLLRHT